MLKKWLAGVVSVAVVGFGGMSAVHANHSPGTVNCGDFASGEEVYEFWESHGYHADNDPEDLDRDSDELPCENLTSGIVGQFDSYKASLEVPEAPDAEEPAVEEEVAEDTAVEENTTDDTVVEEDAADDSAVEEDVAEEATESEEDTEEGDVLPVTSTSYPTMMLFGLAITGFGATALFLFRRRTAQV